jgi:hypothetical protein
MVSAYAEFLHRKSQSVRNFGFEPSFMPDCLYDFQRHIVEWATRVGRGAVFADCGLGKTIMQLTWAQNVIEHTNKPVLLLTPLAVTRQTSREADKFGIEATCSSDGKHAGGIVIANYERLHYFDPNNFAGVVCDESGILKSYQGATRNAITRFLAKMPYRLLCTATPSPNDFIELGTSSEALGEISYSDMLKRFFRQLDDKGQKKELREQGEAESLISIDPNYFKKLAFRVSQSIGQWRLKHHAAKSFWRWVASWAIACRTPSDIGFPNDGFILPELIENDHVITPDAPPPGMLFNVPAVGLQGERQERKRTLTQRCEYIANLVDHDRAAVIWCHGNDEGDMLAETIPGAEQIAGKTPDEKKIELYKSFANGELKKLVIKPKIGAWGLNWQHCNHVVTFASHSYEQHYQAVRRCYRFGQKLPVTVDVIATEGEVRVLGNMRRKSKQADEMFSAIVAEMNQAERIERTNNYTKELEQPAWLS